MELRYEFSEEEFLNLCLKNLNREYSTVAEDLYETLRNFLNTPSLLSVFDVKHRYKQEFYDEHLSLREYINRGRLTLPYVEFELSCSKDIDLEVTAINLPTFIHLGSHKYGGGVTQRYKIKNSKLKTKSKSSINLLSVEFPHALLKKLNSLVTPVEFLLPSKLGVWEWRQTFYNKISGHSYFCSCFKDALEKDEQGLTVIHPHIENALIKRSFRDSICHLCTEKNSDLMFCHKMYGSAFKVKYGAYIRKYEIQEGIDEKEAENRVRDLKGVARIGERWINETLLFNYIQVLFPQYTVQREASPYWLERQRYDIFIPELDLAIEYQGQQHYVAVELFGGKEGLQTTKQRDKEKLQRSKENGIDIIYFNYKDNLTEKLVHSRLSNYLKDK
ncbi:MULTISPECIES: hypothetical protein [Vibrio]|uniref:Uncharacterized protein n=2 Tax=Gammaproteobacteria TaxID=1236 RepID=A0A4U1Z1H6_9VIBR|nr:MULTISPECIES: hypothetical protein [Vibrio]MCG3737836.1 hypothetical protein [Vibrio cincinnatiensis]TKF26107.1 hypothetical protein FCV52_09545 [Vibrio kanaloae]